MGQNKLHAEEFQKMFLRSADGICAAEPYLTQIDTVIGDGDHGEGMKRGFTAVKALLSGKSFIFVDELCYNVSVELIRSMGGASGVIFGTMFLGGIDELPHRAETGCRELARYFMKGEQAIERRGKGKPGQKTMLDALYPACVSMNRFVQEGGEDITEFFRIAKDASEAGAQESRKMLSGKGRSKGFSDLTIGIPDPGAVSASLIFKGFYDELALL